MIDHQLRTLIPQNDTRRDIIAITTIPTLVAEYVWESRYHIRVRTSNSYFR